PASAYGQGLLLTSNDASVDKAPDRREHGIDRAVRRQRERTTMELVSMAHAQDCDVLCKNVVAFAWRLGFERVCATVVLSDPEGGAVFACVQSAPARSPGGPVRPGAQMPRRWRNRREVPAGEACRTGIALALHLAGGRHFFMVADSSRSVSPDRAELARLATEVQGFAVRAQEFAKRAL